jgi:hypothetical protein
LNENGENRSDDLPIQRREIGQGGAGFVTLVICCSREVSTK